MLLGLDAEHTKDLVLTGDVDPASLVVLERLSEQYGFLPPDGPGR